MTDQEELRQAAAAFLAAAFGSLREDNVIPTPTYYPWVTVGRDYFGPELRAADEQHDLEQTLERVYAQRFEERENDPWREFASTYVYSLLDAAVARCGRSGDFATDSQGVKDSIEELTALLDADGEELVCCRVVSHLTADAAPLQLGAVTVLPEASSRRDQAVLIAKEIPAATLAYNRDPPFAYDPPQSVLLIGGRAEAGSVHEVSQTLSQRLDRFLLCVRLLSAATVRSLYELRGARTLCSAHSPQLLSFAGEGLAMGIQRQAQLDGSEAAAIEAIADLVEAAEVKREGLAMHSLDVAIAKFQAASREVSPYERLVDLATALEATLLGGEAANEGLSLRALQPRRRFARDRERSRRGDLRGCQTSLRAALDSRPRGRAESEQAAHNDRLDLDCPRADAVVLLRRRARSRRRPATRFGAAVDPSPASAWLTAPSRSGASTSRSRSTRCSPTTPPASSGAAPGGRGSSSSARHRRRSERRGRSASSPPAVGASQC